MRLGGYFNANTIEDLENVCDKLDCYGLSCISTSLNDKTIEECYEFGKKANELDIVIGEVGFWDNLLVKDDDLRNIRIKTVREMLQKADAMQCNTIISLVGSYHESGSPLPPHPDMFKSKAKDDFYEVVMRILDGLNLNKTKYAIEPWNNCFFYLPDDIKEFIDRVDHPYFGLHLDQANLIDHNNFFTTTKLIEKTFDLLSDKIFGVHLKDIAWDHNHFYLKWDEVDIGDGVMDYDTYLTKISQLNEDIACYCEHMHSEKDYAINFTRLHHIASKNNLSFKTRKTNA